MTKHYYNIKLDIPQDADSAKYFIPKGYTAKFEDGVLIIEPEKSRDERIRKALICGLSAGLSEHNWQGFGGATIDECLAYLERQKEKKPISKTEPIVDGLTEFEKQVSYLIASAMDKEHEYSEGYVKWVSQSLLGHAKFAMSQQEKQKEQKPAEWNNATINGEPIPTENHSVNVPLPEWSEEDKKIAETICKEGDLKPSEKRWLKSLPERFNLQPKQEWSEDNIKELTKFEVAILHIGMSFFGSSAGLNPNNTNEVKKQAKLLLELVPKQEWSEEDERMLTDISWAIRHCAYDDKKKERVMKWFNDDYRKFLRPSWKPSEEQMKVFFKAIPVNLMPEELLIYQSLYDDLQKLM